MRAAFFGGSFDPPHRGHLAIARAAIERLALDRVWMAPVGAQPLKLGSGATDYEDRLAMVELATDGDSRIVASAIDAPKSDGLPNYTVDALQGLRAELGATDGLFFLLGADAFLSLRQWHRGAELPFLCDLIVAGRPGFSMDAIGTSLPEGLRAIRAKALDRAEGVTGWKLLNATGDTSRLYLMPDLHEDISATDIRAAIAGEQSAAGVLSPEVLRYIERKGLYR